MFSWVNYNDTEDIDEKYLKDITKKNREIIENKKRAELHRILELNITTEELIKRAKDGHGDIKIYIPDSYYKFNAIKEGEIIARKILKNLGLSLLVLASNTMLIDKDISKNYILISWEI